MESIPLPSKISVNLDKDNEFKGSLVIEPLYPGYGPTIANSLRRVLLSSLPGAAISAFKIKGVTHEFSSLDYVKEDVVDISLNLKRVNLKSHSDEPVHLILKASGEKIVTAGDIEPNSDVEIANPDQPILTLTDKAADIEISLWVKRGRGYETIEARKNEELEVNAISVDSIFTPIRQVGYQVDNIRVGDRTDFDKVIMEIETNKTISVEEALKISANILSEHFKVIADFSGGAEDLAAGADDVLESDSAEAEENEDNKEDKDE